MGETYQLMVPLIGLNVAKSPFPTKADKEFCSTPFESIQESLFSFYSRSFDTLR